MNKFKSHFRYTNSQRNGIFFLACIIIALQFIYFFVDLSDKERIDLDTELIATFQKKIDSLKQVELENRKPKIYSFNPSFLTDYKGYQLGMSVDQIDRLLQHRNKGKYINSVQEFQQITKVSDSLLRIIAPYFKFPDWLSKKNTSRYIKKIHKTKRALHETKKDINLASFNDFKNISGIGDKLATRILSYRKRLQGFSLNQQLYEVYYLDKTIADIVLEQFEVQKPPTIQKVNINTASFKEVLALPYLDYELTKILFNYRDEVGELSSLDELLKIAEFPLEKFDRIALYLEAK